LARVEGDREQRARSVHMDDPVKDLDNRVSILEGWVLSAMRDDFSRRSATASHRSDRRGLAVLLACQSEPPEKALWKKVQPVEKQRLLKLLAALSHQTDFSIGCYCERADRCHRSVLRDLLLEQGADVR
jgi:hypothetical protein